MPIDHQNVTDPTYLRSIYDGLSAGSINKDNATALPIGLVGVYEEALPPASNVSERKKFLEFFAVWAILKKEVSLDWKAGRSRNLWNILAVIPTGLTVL